MLISLFTKIHKWLGDIFSRSNNLSGNKFDYNSLNSQSVLHSYIQYSYYPVSAKCRPYNGVTACKVSRFDNGYIRFGPIYTNLVRFGN